MVMPKLDAAAKDFFDEVVPTDPRVSVRPMFGAFAAFYEGQMFLGCFATEVFVRLAESDRTALAKAERVKAFEPMAGKSMREYLCLPSGWKDTPAKAAPWVARSMAYVSSLPPKAGKGTGAKSARPPKAARRASALPRRK